LSNASISLYTNTNTIILGLVSGTAAVAYFSAAQTVVRAMQGLYAPISQVLFPKMSHLLHYSKEEGFALLRKLAKLQVGLAMLIVTTLIIFAPFIVSLAFGNKFELATPVLRWLSPSLLLIALSNIFGIQVMVPLGYVKIFSKILMTSGLLNIAIIIPLGYLMDATGAAMAVLVTELLVTMWMMSYLLAHEPKLFKLQS
jgi:O-antigen/teichoic acid export membrane protein